MTSSSMGARFAGFALALQLLLLVAVPLAELRHDHGLRAHAALHAHEDPCDRGDPLEECTLLRTSQIGGPPSHPDAEVRSPRPAVATEPRPDSITTSRRGWSPKLPRAPPRA